MNLYHTLGRLAAVLRPIREDIQGLTKLAMPAELLQFWMSRGNGLVLVTGPTGSGKSTTVAACLNWLNDNHAKHIVTLEDPIEFLFRNEKSLFSQREIRLDTDDFATALRSAMRQSPDVIFLGEIRDSETALTALQAAETGHLVVSTMHSGGVVETIDRFINLVGGGGEGAVQMLAAQLVGVISQRLLPKYGGGLFPTLEYFQTQRGAARAAGGGSGAGLCALGGGRRAVPRQRPRRPRQRGGGVPFHQRGDPGAGVARPPAGDP